MSQLKRKALVRWTASCSSQQQGKSYAIHRSVRLWSVITNKLCKASVTCPKPCDEYLFSPRRHVPHTLTTSHLLHSGFLLGWVSTLKMELIRSSETSVHIRTTRRYIPEGGNIHTNAGKPQILEINTSQRTVFLICSNSCSGLFHHLPVHQYNSAKWCNGLSAIDCKDLWGGGAGD
jgi:hypothetical protein